MTLEEAIEQAERIHAAYVDHSGTEPRNQPCCRDAAESALALGYLLAVARAFPKMLEVLEAVGRRESVTCFGCTTADTPKTPGGKYEYDAEVCHKPDCRRLVVVRALRAAREAVKP